MEGLGRLFDISAGLAPVDLQAAQTGKRVRLRNAAGCTVVIIKGAGTAGDDPVFDLQQHTAASGGTTTDLDIVDHYYLKTASLLTGAETWSRVSQSAASEVSDPGAAGTSAESQQVIVFEVDGTELSDGFEWISVNVADTGTNAQLGAVIYILRDLMVQRAPALLANPQS